VIADRYELIEQIGTGGMATVWKARDTLLGRPVAIKRLLPHLATDPDSAERFKREAQAAASLNHPGIVTVFDTGEDDDGPYIILELVEGDTLAAKLAETAPLAPAAVVDIVSQVGSALDHAHALGVVHRDIKPANLILDPEGRIRLADFGIARTLDDPTTVTATGELVGTISYLAPEILDGRAATPASDIYSLGAVTYELLTGRPPFTAETPAALLEAVRNSEPPSLGGVAPDQMATEVARAMSKDPAQRPSTAGVFAAGLMGSTTLVLGSPLPSRRPMSTSGSKSAREKGGSEEPTVVTAATTVSPVPPPPRSVEPVSQWTRWPLVATLLGVLALAAAAMSNDQDPRDADDARGALPVVETTTTIPMTTTAPTTTIPTTTTTVPTTITLVDTPESVASEIASLLATLQPPQFKPKDVKAVDDRLDSAMEEWETGDRDELIQELERVFEAVGDLETSQERVELTDQLVHLAELMGFDVEQGGEGDPESDD
jgi:serine/threonine protein kinase